MARTLTFDGTLTMGDSGTGTGVLYIDPTSTVLAGDRGAVALVPAPSDALAGGIWNAGTIDLTNGAACPRIRSASAADYYGDGGTLKLDTKLASDDAALRPPDHRRRRRPTAPPASSCATPSGAGAATEQNGILLVACAERRDHPG